MFQSHLRVLKLLETLVLVGIAAGGLDLAASAVPVAGLDTLILAVLVYAIAVRVRAALTRLDERAAKLEKPGALLHRRPV